MEGILLFNVFLISFLTVAGSTSNLITSHVSLLLALWEVVDIVGQQPVNFGSGAAPSVYFSIGGSDVFGSTDSLNIGFSVGLWAKRQSAAIASSLFHAYTSGYI